MISTSGTRNGSARPRLSPTRTTCKTPMKGNYALIRRKLEAPSPYPIHT
jgi:hypothetical protein